MPTVTERLAILVEANADKAIAEFKQLGAATKNLQGDAGKAGGLLSNISGQLGGLAAGGAAAAGVALVGFAASGVKAFIDLATEVEKFQGIAGGTTEDASRLVAALDDVGVDAAKGANGIFQLAKRLETGADKLRAFGVEAVRNADGTTNMSETLLSVGDAYKRVADPAKRAALLTAAFGKSGADLIPLLKRSRAEIQGFFAGAEDTEQILSPEDIVQAREFREAMDDLQDAMRGLQIEAGKALVPFLSDLGKAISGTIDWINKVREALNIKAGDARGAGGWLDDMIDFPWEDTKTKVDNTTGSVHSLGDAFAPLISASSDFADVADEDAKALDALDQALSKAVNADRALTASHGDLAEAQRALSDLQAKGAVDAEKVADATRSLESAQRSLRGAQRDQTEAQDEYNEALANFARFGSDTAADKLADAENNLADANDSVADAQGRVIDAQEDLGKARAGDPGFQDKLAAAKKRVADATFDVSVKTLAAATAHEAEAAALEKNAGQAQALYDKYGALIAQHPDVIAALAGNLAALGGAVPNNAGGGDIPPAPVAGPAVPARGPVNITNNITAPMDPSTLSRRMIWDLN